MHNILFLYFVDTLLTYTNVAMQFHCKIQYYLLIL